jgi:2-polyprenyl-6-methoxyphenol hydroxylase-like FAD-dependent oxidoreductase
VSTAPTAGADVDVLVVGAGPTGLMAACQLLRYGIRVRVIDQSPTPAIGSRALSIWPRALDIFDDLGLGDEIRAASVQVNAFSYFSDRRLLATFHFTDDLASRILPQPETERLLTERLHAMGGKVERGVRLLSLDEASADGPDGSGAVTVLLEHADGILERVEVPYVIGADGARSSVRGQLGAGFQGSTYEMAFVLVDARIQGHLPGDEVSYYQTPAGTLVIVPAPGGVFRFLSVAPDGRREVSVPMMQSIIDERGPRGVRITEPVWQTVFRVHARHAEPFHRGRVFLVGDAAHVHSPAGGQGMNNGLQDAHNLGWKLAAVIRGDSPDSLLLSYSPERTAATRRIIRDTDVQTRAWMVAGPARVRVRDAAFRLLDRTGVITRHYTPVIAGRRLAYPPVRASQLPARLGRCRLSHRLPGGVPVGAAFPRPLALAYGISGPHLTGPPVWTVALSAGTNRGGWLREVEHITARFPRTRVVRLTRGDAAAYLGCTRDGYHLVRPDGHIAAHGHDTDLNRLETELGHVLRPAAR